MTTIGTESEHHPDIHQRAVAAPARFAAYRGRPPAAWEWHVTGDRLLRSEWLLRERRLPGTQRVTTLAGALAAVHPEDRAGVEAAFRGAAADLRPVVVTYRVTDGLGRLRTVVNAADVVVADGGVRLLGAVADLTDDDDAAFLDAVLDSLADGLVVCSRAGVPVVVNHAARGLYERATGARWDDHAGREWLAALLASRPRDEPVPAWRDPVRLALSGASVRDVELETGDRPPRRRVVRVSAEPIRGSVAARGAVVTLHDVTERHDGERDGGGGAGHHGDDDLSRALAEGIRTGELVLHYQPKIELESRRMVGVEALVRWDRPGHGLVPPGEFIAAAEASGVIVELGAWVLRTALADARRWTGVTGGRPSLGVSVNVSTRQFGTAFPELVREALASSGVDPSLLCLEVTESTVMSDVESAAEMLTALRSMGLTVSIDDFGTGYSSLSYLRHFPVDELKADRSFVAGLGREPADTALVGGIVSLAHALALEVVAEGVETEEQLVALATVGCDIAQGYYFSRPVPAERITELLATEPAHDAADDARRLAPGADTVLVSDDAEDVRLLARMSLATSGFDVHEAGDGPAALEAARALRPAVVVLDVRMPGLDGFSVCRALRNDPATADCTIVMLTATATAMDKVNAYSAGADDYIVKPFSPRELVSRVRGAQRRRAESARAAR